MLRINSIKILNGSMNCGRKSIIRDLSGVRRNFSKLVFDKGFINGEWVTAASNKKFDVFNPASETVIGQCADMDKSDTQKAIDAAYETFHTKEWQHLPAKERSGLLKVWRDKLIA